MTACFVRHADSRAAAAPARTLRAPVPALAALAVLTACSAPPLHADLAAAEQLARSGDLEAALAAYATAAETCADVPSPSRRRRTCADAHLGRAELLERVGRDRDAAAAYEQIPAALDGDPGPSSAALYRAGRLYLALDEDRRAYDLLWRTIAEYPGEPFAADALRLVVRDGRRRDPDQLYAVLSDLLGALAGTRIADNLLYWLADLAEHEQSAPERARNFYDRIAEYPDSGLRDDAWWHAARLSRALGDHAGAARRLRALLATREVAFGAGSYFSIWLDNAQLELGRVLRDGLGDTAGAIAALSALPELYPASVLRDDALWEIAVTWERAGDRARACATLARLRARWPESRYELPAYAPAMRARLGCTEPGRDGVEEG